MHGAIQQQGWEREWNCPAAIREDSGNERPRGSLVPSASVSKESCTVWHAPWAWVVITYAMPGKWNLATGQLLVRTLSREAKARPLGAVSLIWPAGGCLASPALLRCAESPAPSAVVALSPPDGHWPPDMWFEPSAVGLRFLNWGLTTALLAHQHWQCGGTLSLVRLSRA